MTIDAHQLDLLALLAPAPRAIAREFLRLHPDAELLRTASSIAEQAWAMADHVVGDPNATPPKLPNRRWVIETYAGSPACEQIQSWIDRSPDATTRELVSQGIASVLMRLSSAELHHLTWHIPDSDAGAEAFDVAHRFDREGVRQVVTLTRLEQQHLQRGGEAKLLVVEGGRDVWHLQASNTISPLPDPAAPIV